MARMMLTTVEKNSQHGNERTHQKEHRKEHQIGGIGIGGGRKIHGGLL